MVPTCNPTEIVAGQLWRLGRVTLGGQVRELMFASGYRATAGSAVVDSLRTRTKSILLMPSELGVSRWGSVTGNLVIAMECVTSIGKSGIELELELIETRVAAHFGAQSSKPSPKRRAA